MPILTVMNQKGGVGKTTSALNLAAALQERGLRVLMVDFDPQGSLTTCCGLADSNQLIDAATIADAVLTTVRAKANRKVSLKEIIVTTPAGIDLAPASQDLATAEATLYTTYGREYALRDTLAQVRDQYDVILIDGVPTLGLLAVNGLAAADGLIIPVQAEYLAVYGLAQLLYNVELVRERLNPRLKIWGILLTMVDTRTKHSREVVATVRETFAKQVPVFETHIPVDVKLKESAKAGMTVFAYDPASRATRAYRDLATEVHALFDQPASTISAVEGEAPAPPAKTEPAAASAPTRSGAAHASDGDVPRSDPLPARPGTPPAASIPPAASTTHDGPSVIYQQPAHASTSSNGHAPRAAAELGRGDHRSAEPPPTPRRTSSSSQRANDILPPSLRRRIEINQGAGSFPWLTEDQQPPDRAQRSDESLSGHSQPLDSTSDDDAVWRQADSPRAPQSNVGRAAHEQHTEDGWLDGRESRTPSEMRPLDGSTAAFLEALPPQPERGYLSSGQTWSPSPTSRAREERNDSTWYQPEQPDDAEDTDRQDEQDSWSADAEIDQRQRLEMPAPPTIGRETERTWQSSAVQALPSDLLRDAESQPDDALPSAHDSHPETGGTKDRSPLQIPSSGTEVRPDGADLVLSPRQDSAAAPSASSEEEAPDAERVSDVASLGTDTVYRSGWRASGGLQARSIGTFHPLSPGTVTDAGLKANGAARLSPPSDPAMVCPYLGLADNRANHRSEPCAEHRCYAKNPPIEVNGWQQSTYCLGGRNGTCVHFLQARVQFPTGDGGSSLFGKVRSAFKSRGDGR